MIPWVFITYQYITLYCSKLPNITRCVMQLFQKKDRKIQIVDQTLISENAMFRKHCKYK